MRPPRFSQWMLERAAAREDRADLVADAAEEADAIAREHGESAARAWYRRQAARSVLPLLQRRFAAGLTLMRIGRHSVQDLRYAVRSLASAPIYSLTVVLLLGLGIGAHIVAYAVVDGLLLRPLPFGDRGPRLVTVHSTHPTLATDWNDSELSYLDLMDLRRDTRSVAAIEGVIGRNLSVSNGREAERVAAASVTTGLFSMLGVAPMLGRDFVEADGALPGFETVVILGHAAWQSMFGGDRSAIGRAIWINGRPLTVVGVMPPGFAFPNEQQVWLPYRGHPESDRAARTVLAVGLLRPDVSIEEGAAELKAIAARLADRHPATNREWSVHLMRLRDFLVSGSDATTLLGAVTLVVLVACANVAGLIVARGVGRQRELTLRAALGADRLRLIRLLVLETVVIAALGGALGLAAAGAGIRAIVAWIPEPPPSWALPQLDLRVAGFAVALTAIVALVAGLVPAIRLSRVTVAGSLLPDSRGAGESRGHRRLQQTLVVGQIGASLALLIGALLLGNSATALFTADGGFHTAPLLSGRFYIAGDRYDEIPVRASTVSQIVERISTIPDVRAAAATGSIPTDDGGAAIRLEAPSAGGPGREIGAQLIPASPSLWATLGLSLVEGRTFTDSESLNPAAQVVIVNRRLASQFWPGEDAVGHVIRYTEGATTTSARVVGVGPDLVYEEFGEETPQSQLNVYVPYAAAPWRTQAVLVNVAANPAAVSDSVRAAIRAVDPGFAVYDLMTMTDRRAYNHWSARFIGRTFFVFAAAALLLACIGAYGIAAYAVARRRREIGIRMAIGATRTRVLWLFIGTGARLAAGGLIVGLPLALITARLLEHELFRVSPWSAAVWCLPPAILALAVVAACYFPARRATLIDPASVLKID